MLVEHKKSVEAQIEEMQKYLIKVSHKINFFTSQYEKYSAAKSSDSEVMPQAESAKVL